MRFIVIVGASGSGKTTLTKRLEQRKGQGKMICLYFDHIIGNEDFGTSVKDGGENWQRLATEQWCGKIAKEYGQFDVVILDAQSRWSFVQDGCSRSGLAPAELILIDCEDSERKRRLIERGHSDLGNNTMMNWADWLRKDAKVHSVAILDTTGKTLEESESELARILRL